MHRILSHLSLCKITQALHWYDVVVSEVMNFGRRLSSLRRCVCSLSMLKQEIYFEKQVKEVEKNLIIISSPFFLF